MSRRSCADCGATCREARFPGARKPYRQPDRCVDCVADPLKAQRERVETRLLEIQALRAGASERGRTWRAPKPAWSAPLFAALRP